MWSPLSPFGGTGFTSPHMPSRIFPSVEDRAATMDEVSYYDDEDEHDDDDSDDDGSPNVGGFPPRVRDWEDVNYGKQPIVTVDRARRDVFIQFISEHNFIRHKIDNNIRGSGEPVDKVVSLLFGPTSPVFRVFADHLSLAYDQFCRFLSSFYMSCRYNMNWRKM